MARTRHSLLILSAFFVLSLYAIVGQCQIDVVQTAQYTTDRLTPKAQVSWSTGTPPDADATVVVDRTQLYQTMFGFGGALTEAAAYNWAQMNPTVQQELLDLYYGPNGIHYTVGRTHINSCDFSVDSYNFVNVSDDYKLQSWDFSREHKYLLPLLVGAFNTVTWELNLFVTPWSPPGWMKGNGQMDGSSFPGLLNASAIHIAWAYYLSYFITQLDELGIPVWGMTVQNEPQNPAYWEACVYDAEQQRDFIKYYLGPQLAEDHPDLQLMIYDHNKDNVTVWADIILSDPEAAQYVDGVAIHWYSGPQFNHVAETHNAFPEKFILATEACNCPGVQIDYWPRGEAYGYDIIGDIQNWAVGWTDWNMMLDSQGGPNHVENFCDAPVIVFPENQTYHIQPPYWYLGQLSKFVYPGSVRIQVNTTEYLENVSVTGFTTDNFDRVIVVMSQDDTNTSIVITDGDYYFEYELLPHSIVTFMYDEPSESVAIDDKKHAEM